jgi:transposase-like protein
MTKAERIQNRIEWEHRVAAFNESGVSVPTFCKTHDLNVHQLRYWLKKFKTKPTLNSPSSKWMAVEVDSIDRSQSVVIRAGKVSVEVYPGFDPSHLADVIKVLNATC